MHRAAANRREVSWHRKEERHSWPRHERLGARLRRRQPLCQGGRERGRQRRRRLHRQARDAQQRGRAVAGKPQRRPSLRRGRGGRGQILLLLLAGIHGEEKEVGPPRLPCCRGVGACRGRQWGAGRCHHRRGCRGRGCSRWQPLLKGLPEPACSARRWAAEGLTEPSGRLHCHAHGLCLETSPGSVGRTGAGARERLASPVARIHA
mmetsp:Transcript_23325/g.52535  ORF Transcript_23325/g.52535 Transcript_23325/m.52535 type:complete len:206 (-) Transcript_23325:14-631(-)